MTVKPDMENTTKEEEEADWSPFILMCGQCRRVVSDSNQLLCAVAELDALVFDAVVGVRVSDAVDDNNEGGSLGKLTCSACQAELGRVYYRPPASLQHLDIVHQSGASRYTLYRSALGSYALGTAKAQHDASRPASSSEAAPSSNGVTRVPQQQQPEGSSVADEVRLQLSQLMRVVLGLDQRLRALEDTPGREEQLGQKRAR